MDIQQMMNTRHGLGMLQAWVASNPCLVLPDKDGKPTDNIRLPPARLSFPFIAEGDVSKDKPGAEPKYGGNLLFVPGTNLDALKAARLRVLAAKVPGNPQGLGMKDPIRNQSERVAPSAGGANPKGITFSGYVPNAPFIIPRTNRQPPLYVPPITNGEPTRFVGSTEEIAKTFYAGCWVIATVNPYWSPNKENPNVWFGLVSLLKILDDNEFKGDGGVDPRVAYGGIQMPTVSPESLF